MDELPRYITGIIEKRFLWKPTKARYITHYLSYNGGYTPIYKERWRWLCYMLCMVEKKDEVWKVVEFVLPKDEDDFLREQAAWRR